jgi:hypothetical protein
MTDVEPAETEIGVGHEVLDAVDARTWRPMTRFRQEGSDLLGPTCRANLDPSVRQVAHVATNPMTSRRLENEPAKPHALNPSRHAKVREARIRGCGLLHLASLRLDDRKRLVGAP